MKQLQILLNQQYQLTLSTKGSLTVEQLKNLIIQTLKFPKQSQYQIEIDGHPRDPSFQLPFHPQFPIIANFQYQTTVSLKNEFIQIFQHQLDLCQSVVEIQKQLAKNILPIDYQIILLQNGNSINESFLNSYTEIPKQLDFKVQASMYINYNLFQHQLQINPYQKIRDIKQLIISKFKVLNEFSLLYKNKILNDDNQFITYLIPNHSEITIKLQQRILFTVKYQNNIHHYSTVKQEKLGAIKNKLKNNFKIPDKEKLELIYQNKYLNIDDQQTMSFLDKKVDHVLEITIGKIFIIKLEDDSQQQKFECQVQQTDLISALDNYSPFKDYQVTYYFGRDELDKNKSFESIQSNNEIIINIQFKLKKKLITVYFQDENFKQIKMEVSITDPIQIALNSINTANDPVIIIYNDKKISVENTYASQAIKNEGVILYYLNQFLIKYSIAPYQDEYSLQITQKINGAQLLNIISKNYRVKSQTFKLMLNNIEFPANQMVDPKENQCYKLIPYFEIPFRFLNDGKIYKESFSIQDSILNARQRFSQKFNIPLAQLFTSFLENPLKDEQLLQQYSRKEIWIFETIQVKFQKRDGNLLVQKNYNKNLQVKEIFKDFFKQFSQQVCKCLLNNQQVNELNMLKDITNQTEVTFVVDFLQELQLIDKQKIQKETIVQFYPKDIVAPIFSRYIRGNFLFYHNDQLIDTNMDFEDNHIQNKSQIYFEEFHFYTLEILKDNSLIQIKACPFSTKIKQAIYPQIQEKYSEPFTAFYKNYQIDIEKTFSQEKIMDQGIIQINFYNQLYVIVEDEDHKKRFSAPQNQIIGELIKKLKGNQNKKLFNARNQDLLEDHIMLSTLINNNNVVELIYKEVYNNGISAYLPSQTISTSSIEIQNIATTQTFKIEIQNTENDIKFDEVVKLNQKVGDFIDYFEQKMEFSNKIFFYDGEIVDRNKTFEEINVIKDNKFEIV